MGYESGAIAVRDTNTGSHSYGAKEIYLSSTGGYVYGATAVYNTDHFDSNAQEVYRSSTGGAVYGAIIDRLGQSRQATKSAHGMPKGMLA